MFLTHCLDFRSDSKIVFCTIISGHHPLKNGAWEISLSFWEGLFSERNMLVLGSRVSSNHSFESRPSFLRKPLGCAAGWCLKPHACSMASRKGIKTSLGSIKIPDPQPVLPQPRPCYREEPETHLYTVLIPGFWRKGNQSDDVVSVKSIFLLLGISKYFKVQRQWKVTKNLQK